MTQYFIMFGAAFGISLLVTPWVSKLAFRIGAVDKPGKRKVHTQLMPRLGGVAVFAGFMAIAVIFYGFDTRVLGIMAGGSIILLLGILDDKYDLPARYKLLGQIAAAAVVVATGTIIRFVDNPFDGYIGLGAFAIPLTILWIVGITNALNLIDGLDGLASGISLIALTTFTIMAYRTDQVVVAMLTLALAGAVLGFLRYNFHPASIFLGDSGAMFLGFMIASLAVMGLLKSVTAITFITPVLVLAVPILDTAFAMIRRFINGKPIMHADKGHLHHRLLAFGLSHKHVVLVIYGFSIMASLAAMLILYR